MTTPAPTDLTHAYTFTFGPDHVLRNGQIQIADRSKGGLSLGPYYVHVFAYSGTLACIRMVEAFGRMWSEMYPPDRGQEVISRYQLKPLFELAVEDTISAFKLCDCGNLNDIHTIGWHADHDQDVR